MHLVIDNYDSFTWNIVQYLSILGAEVVVRRNDDIDIEDISSLQPESLIISPGPCSPREAGISMEAIRYFAGHLPILGVCLGHQCVAAAFGGEVRRANEVLHGKVSLMEHNRQGLFIGLEDNLRIARYHSLVVDNLPPELEPVAWARRPDGGRGEIMALRHRDFDIYGLQFHPESVLTEQGLKMLGNYLRLVENALVVG
ncbi:anthranilate synthase component II [Lonsdalea quercina]|uniref:anthranilate synthase component II n=1 Tax=Lonsdalea quercina TaxID=71657 RepID=UPI003975AEBB